MLVILLYNFDKPSHRSDQYQAAGGRAEKSDRTLNEMKVKCFISCRFLAAMMREK